MRLRMLFVASLKHCYIIIVTGASCFSRSRIAVWGSAVSVRKQPAANATLTISGIALPRTASKNESTDSILTVRCLAHPDVRLRACGPSLVQCAEQERAPSSLS